MLRAVADALFPVRNRSAGAASAPPAAPFPPDRPNLVARSPDRSNILAVEGVTRFFGGLAAKRNVTFTVHAGEIVALIGPNGAGKGTLFDVIGGVLAPSAGNFDCSGERARGCHPGGSQRSRSHAPSSTPSCWGG